MEGARCPYLARHFRVVTIDPRGNGRSDRPTDPAAYGDLEYIADTIAVMDHLDVDRAVLVSVCFSRVAGADLRIPAPGPRIGRGGHRAVGAGRHATDP